MAAFLGIHVLYELYECDAALLDDVEVLRRTLYDAVRSVEMVALQEARHQYEPQGASVVILVAESHIAVHTWPEYRYAAVDFFSCRTDIDPERVRVVLERALKPGRIDSRLIERGHRASPHPPGAG